MFILRGVQGSGKSSLARGLVADEGVIHSTDDFFFRGGVYAFNPEKLKEYHALNFRRFKESLRRGIPVVVADNTNVTRLEWVHYAQTAGSFGYDVIIVSLPHPDPEEAAKRNVHGVPASEIRKAILRWED